MVAHSSLNPPTKADVQMYTAQMHVIMKALPSDCYRLATACRPHGLMQVASWDTLHIQPFLVWSNCTWSRVEGFTLR
jgi:hypothetical protein